MVKPILVPAYNRQKEGDVGEVNGNLHDGIGVRDDDSPLPAEGPSILFIGRSARFRFGLHFINNSRIDSQTF